MEFSESAREALYSKSGALPVEPVKVVGYDFNNGVDYHKLLNSYLTTGFQATNFGYAVNEINRMIKKRSEPPPELPNDASCHLPQIREARNCTIFLGYTSNMISCGVREIIRFLAEHNMIDCIVTTAGGVEEDIIKCFAPSYIGDFNLRGRELRNIHINRTGNLLVPNDNYCIFEEWTMPILDQMLIEQQEQGILWSPSSLIARFGKEINNPESVLYWCYKNNIPVYSPAITDGAIGDVLFFHSLKHPGLVVDVIEDTRRLNSQVLHARNTGGIILGGGLVKHHIFNANLMRNGLDYCVLVNTGQEFDGSDAGARPDEAISWGKIRSAANPVKIFGDATLVFPVLVAETFARHVAGESTTIMKQNGHV